MIPIEIRRAVSIAIAVCILILAGLTLAWCNARQDASRARQEARVSQGATKAAQEAVTVTDGVLRGEQTQRELDRVNNHDIARTENADEDAGAAGRAGLGALCGRLPDNPACGGNRLLRSARSDPSDGG